MSKKMEWQKNKYKRFVADIDKDAAEEFLIKLNEENKTFQGWVKEHISKYLNS